MTDQKNAALDVAKDGVKEVVKQISWSSPAVELASFVVLGLFHSFQRHKFEGFFDSIRMRLDLDGEQLHREIQEHQDKRWMAEGLARGWSLSLETMDDAARECAHYMVADYIRQKRNPDLLHRRLGGLFKDSDQELLSIYLEIADLLHEADYPVVEVVRVPQMMNDGAPFMAFFKQLKKPIRHKRVMEAGEILVSNALATGGSANAMTAGPRAVETQKQTICRIFIHHTEAWKALRGYLKPVRG